MKTQISPIVGGIAIALAVAVIGYFLYTQTAGKTFTKAEASGSSSGRMGAGMDLSKMQQQLPAGAPK